MEGEAYRTAPHRAALAAAPGEDALVRLEVERLGLADIAVAWAQYDADGSGGLDKDELHTMLSALSVVLQGSVALSLCTTAHPLYGHHIR